MNLVQAALTAASGTPPRTRGDGPACRPAAPRTAPRRSPAAPAPTSSPRSRSASRGPARCPRSTPPTSRPSTRWPSTASAMPPSSRRRRGPRGSGRSPAAGPRRAAARRSSVRSPPRYRLRWYAARCSRRDQALAKHLQLACGRRLDLCPFGLKPALESRGQVAPVRSHARTTLPSAATACRRPDSGRSRSPCLGAALRGRRPPGRRSRRRGSVPRRARRATSGSPGSSASCQRFERGLDAGLLLDAGPSASRTSDAVRRHLIAGNLPASLANRLPSQTGSGRKHRVAAVADGERLGRRPPAATALVQQGPDRRILRNKGRFQLDVSLYASSMTRRPAGDKRVLVSVLRIGDIYSAVRFNGYCFELSVSVCPPNGKKGGSLLTSHPSSIVKWPAPGNVSSGNGILALGL